MENTEYDIFMMKRNVFLFELADLSFSTHRVRIISGNG